MKRKLPEHIKDVIDDFKLNGEGLLWEIKDNNINYLFGTYHSADPRILDFFNDNIKKVFDLANVYVLESLQGDPSLIMKPGQTLKQKLPSDLYEQIVQISKYYDIPLKELRRKSPWAMCDVLQTTVEEYKRRAKQENPVLDYYIERLAREASIPVYSLEDNIPSSRQRTLLNKNEMISFVRQAMEINTQIEKHRENHINNYIKAKNSDIHEYWESISPNIISSELFKRVEREDCWSRNSPMVQNMEQYLMKGNAFIAVGSFHLLGKNGIINLLRENGYIVTRMY